MMLYSSGIPNPRAALSAMKNRRHTVVSSSSVMNVLPVRVLMAVMIWPAVSVLSNNTIFIFLFRGSLVL